MSLPAGVVVSAQLSPNDLKLAPLSPIAARVLSKSRVDLAKRSSLQTTNTSPLPSPPISFAKAGLSVTAPEIFSL
jgi:hypothetical protein